MAKEAATLTEPVWIEPDALEFGEEPPEQRRTHANADQMLERQLQAALRKNKGKWAVVSKYPIDQKSEARQRTQTIKMARRAVWLEGRWDSRWAESTDGTCIEVWATYLGKDPEGTTYRNVAGRTRKMLPDGTIIGSKLRVDLDTGKVIDPDDEDEMGEDDD